MWQAAEMRWVRGMLAMLLALAVSGIASAQQNPLEVSRLAEGFRDNQAAVRQYSWTSRTLITVGGKFHASGLHRVRYLPDGTVDRSPIASEADAAGSSAGNRKRSKKQDEWKISRWEVSVFGPGASLRDRAYSWLTKGYAL